MKIIKKQSILLIFLLVSFIPIDTNSNIIIDEWGLGIISNTDKPNKSEIINYPLGTMNVYEKPNGEVIGTISKEKDYVDYYYNVELTLNSYLKPVRINRNDVKEINYEGTCLKYYKKEDGFLKIMNYTHENGVWISIKELKSRGFIDVSWKQFLLKREDWFVILYKNEIPLMEKPDEKSKTILNINNFAYSIFITGEEKGNWIPVTIKQYNFEDELRKNPIKKFSGWIKLLDEFKHPLIWYFTRGC